MGLELERVFWIVASVLVVFGIIYDRCVGYWERHGHHEGYTAFLVVVGVLVTLAGLALWKGLDLAVYVALLFIASGTPMILGSMARYAQKRASEEKRTEVEALEKLR